MKLRNLFVLTLLIFLSSCVSKRKYNDTYALWVYTDSQFQMLKYKISNEKKNCEWMYKEVIRLKKDSVKLDSVFRAYIAASQTDKAKLVSEITNKETQVKFSNAKIKELEALIFRKDSIMKATKERLTAALVGFAEKGVNVHVVGGKVYISLDERLLFQSGKIDVGDEGKKALKEIATALNQDTTTILTVEGHTDDVEYNGKGYFKDNWDISVLRATSVVRLLQKDGAVSPRRFIASGRAEFLPLDASKTEEARKKNRRIEIIITPDLDEIAKLLGAQ
jgi:chemotaxis protein MotB